MLYQLSYIGPSRNYILTWAPAVRLSAREAPILNDFLLAVRNVFKRPAFAATIVIVLALGIGANSAVFSVIDAVLLKPLPFPQADRASFE